MPVQSMITSPSPHDVLAAAKSDCESESARPTLRLVIAGSSITVKGIAWGGGGLGVARVDVSVDDGENFTRAELLEKPIKEYRKSQWSWQFFEQTVPLSEELRSAHEH